jgi:hypothetical protein
MKRDALLTDPHAPSRVRVNAGVYESICTFPTHFLPSPAVLTKVRLGASASTLYAATASGVVGKRARGRVWGRAGPRESMRKSQARSEQMEQRDRCASAQEGVQVCIRRRTWCADRELAGLCRGGSRWV